MSGVLLWDVDTQVDFIDGKLSVPGAKEALPAMRHMVRWAKDNGAIHLATVDDHELTDPEISDNPDYESTFPPHCLRGTPGVAKVEETRQEDPLPLSLTPYPEALLQQLVSGHREILVLKKTYDAFSNPNLEPLLAALNPSCVVLFGVAIDICNHAAVLGLFGRGYKVWFVEDASRGLDDQRVAAVLEEWRDLGVRFTTSDKFGGAPS